MLFDDTINVILCLRVMFSVLIVLHGLIINMRRITKNDHCLIIIWWTRIVPCFVTVGRLTAYFLDSDWKAGPKKPL